MRLILKAFICLLVVGTMTSCVSKKKYDELTAAKVATDQALAETQADLKTLGEEKDALQAEFTSETERLNGEIAGIKSDLAATKGQVTKVEEKLAMTEKELAAVKAEINGVFSTYKNSGLSLEEKGGKLYVMTSEKMNFKSGSIRLSKDQKAAIEGLATTLQNNPSLSILVEGHTDDKKILGGAYKDNWELSTERALVVVRQLIKNGVNPSQVAAVGRGETMPVSSNETAEGREMNRRSTVVTDPNLSTILD